MKIIALTTLILTVAGAAWSAVEITERVPARDFRVLVTRGVVVQRTVLLEGRQTTVPAIRIGHAINAQGQSLNAYQGRTLLAIGPLADQILDLEGRQVVVRGIVRRDGLFEVTWIQDKHEASRNIHAPTPVW